MLKGQHLSILTFSFSFTKISYRAVIRLDYLQTYNRVEFCNNCDLLLNLFLEDYNLLLKRIEEFISL